ncbi:protein Vhl isoform X1 [Drosophila montana]|uniref:protein Vhl isoform X1 n=1 Tax=Drosophila montana TaxID=40370 RepID=UPI00313DDD2D
MALQIARNNREWGEHLRAMPQEEVEVYVLFVNTTNRTVDLYWVRDPDTENIQVTLKPNEGVPVNTYNTHIWFFRDYYTGERMHVRSQRLFFPVRIRMPRNPQQPEELCDVRTQILIHFPLRTLKENCLWFIVRWLRRTYDAPREYINSYMIPVTLKQQLLILSNTIESYCSQAHQMRRRMRARR